MVVLLTSQWMIILDIRDLFVEGKYADGEPVTIKWGLKQGRIAKGKNNYEYYS